jgi:hypothetical protein
MRPGASIPVPNASNGTADESEMKCGGEHVPVARPDFNETGISGRNQMERVESSQIA